MYFPLNYNPITYRTLVLNFKQQWKKKKKTLIEGTDIVKGKHNGKEFEEKPERSHGECFKREEAVCEVKC